MYDLNEISVFVEVVKKGSFTKAANEMRIPKSTLSRKVQDLEERLGLQLLLRTTRSLKLTPVGEKYFAKAATLVEGVKELEGSIVSEQEKIKGVVRMTAPVEIGVSELPVFLAELRNKYPEIEIEVNLSERVVDLNRENFDFALRAGKVEELNLVVKRVSSEQFSVFISPQFYKKIGNVKHPKQLEELPAIICQGNIRDPIWNLSKNSERVKIKPQAGLRVDSFALALKLSSQGCGICYAPNSLAKDFLISGELIRVLPDWEGESTRLNIVYPQQKYLSSAVRCVVEALFLHLKTNKI